MAVTIKDIAKYTGVSVSTVSMALSGKECRISQATREKVRAAAKELNYHPNRMAAGLVTKTTKTLGLIVPDITNSYFAEIASVAEAKCALNGYSLFLCNTNDMPEQDAKYANLLLEQSVDGILAVMAVNSRTGGSVDCFHLLREAGVPVLLLDREWRGENIVNVTMDNERGGYLACRHLLELGHRRIGFLTGHRENQSSQKRLEGCVRAFKEFGAAPDSELVIEGDYRIGSGYASCGEFLKREATAIFAFGDMMALGIMKRLREKGISVPDGVSVIGYDDLAFTDCLEVPLTTVSQPAAAMVETAVAKMLEMLRGKHPESAIFVPELVVRDSTARPCAWKG